MIVTKLRFSLRRQWRAASRKGGPNGEQRPISEVAPEELAAAIHA
jgi:hypothetical protein